jgi:hypothetical protein
MPRFIAARTKIPPLLRLIVPRFGVETGSIKLSEEFKSQKQEEIQ